MKLAELVNQHYQTLSENDLYIWDYIQAHQSECLTLSINELAKRCHVSKTTILRFAQKLSLKGYSELKVVLHWEQKSVEQDTVSDPKLVEQVLDTCQIALQEIKERNFDDICALLFKAKRIFVYGTGALQNSIAHELQRMFMYCGEFLHILSGEKETEMVLPFLEKEDVVILISLRGEGELINTFASQLRVRGVSTISMTKMKNNELAYKSTKSIYITTSQVFIGNHILHEAANLFFVLAEILFLRFSQYKERNEKSEGNASSHNP